MAGSGSGSGNFGSLKISKEEIGGKNKRKLVDPPPKNPFSHPSSLTEFPPYDPSFHKYQNPQSCAAAAGSSSSQSDDWSDPLACQLEELLLSTIRTIYQNAINILVRRGYDEDTAQKAISRLGFYHEGADIVENIVNDAESFLKHGKDSSRDIVFENLQQMVEYTMLELVNVVRQVKPSLPTGEVMWLLLICDMNVSQACQMEEDLLAGFNGKEISRGCSEFPQNTIKPNIASSSSLPQDQSCMQETVKSSSVQPASQAISFDEKLKMGNKSLNKKEVATLQKTLNAEKVLKDHGKSISQSGKITSLGGVNIEKSSKSSSNSRGGKTKRSASKMKAKVGASTVGGSCQIPSNAPSIDSTPDDSSKVQIKKPISAATETTENVVSEKKPALKLESRTVVSPKISDYCAGIPYDKSSGKHVPQDKKDELILKLVPQVQALENEAQDWTNWANQKVMQAAHRLNKDKLELKALRQEKEEAEQLKKFLEENTRKRLSDMQFALGKATSQVETANSNIQSLEVTRSKLKKEMEMQKLQAVQTAKNFQEAFERELKALKEVQSINKQKKLLEDELKTNREKVAELQQEKGKAEKVYNQTEAKWNQEKALKEAMLAQFASIKHEQSKAEAARKAEEDMIKRRAEISARKYKEDIAKLEKEVSELRLKSEASKIAALKKGMMGGIQNQAAAAEVTIQETKGMKRERECIMCLTEEKSVIFLPCAHQVLCKNCNELHRRKGMKECPSCRTPIQERFPARFINQ